MLEGSRRYATILLRIGCARLAWGYTAILAKSAEKQVSERIKPSRMETRAHRAKGAAEAAPLVGLRVYKQALERQVQGKLDKARAPKGVLNDALSKLRRPIANGAA